MYTGICLIVIEKHFNATWKSKSSFSDFVYIFELEPLPTLAVPGALPLKWLSYFS